MKKFDTIHLLFEQSGRFRDYFKSLGYEAYDYDIENRFETTDYVIDLFNEIKNGYEHRQSIFDNIKSSDLIIAIFPCTYFSGQNDLIYNRTIYNFRNLTEEEVDTYIVERKRERENYFQILNMLVDIVEQRNLKMIVENPYTGNYLRTQKRFEKPSLIIMNRRIYGDYYIKPTMFYYYNLEATLLTDKARVLKERKLMTVNKQSGIKRSLMSEEFVENFVNKHILGV